jgi:hypothetical protein
MIAAECKCGDEVHFHIPERQVGPIRETCDCGRVYKLKVTLDARVETDD